MAFDKAQELFIKYQALSQRYTDNMRQYEAMTGRILPHNSFYNMAARNAQAKAEHYSHLALQALMFS